MNGTSITVVGNVTKDPTLRYSGAGKPIASFSVAVNYRKFNRATNDWEEEEATFFDVSCFDSLAENVAESVSKGTRVMVEGRMRNRSWQGRDGDTRYSLEILADEVGPSLRWASASVERNPREGGGSRPARTPDTALTSDLDAQFAPVGGDDNPFG